MKRASLIRIVSCLGCIVLPLVAKAEDAYYQIPLGSLSFTEGSLPANVTYLSRGSWRLQPALDLRVLLTSEGEAYVDRGTEDGMAWGVDRNPASDILSVRGSKGRDLTGCLFVPNTNSAGMLRLEFKISADKAPAGTAADFLQARERHYRQLQSRAIPGAAWFRHQADESLKARGITNESSDVQQPIVSRQSELEDAYNLFTGGRALSENLQLDRILPPTTANARNVAITNLTGITVQEMNWKELLQGASPALDPLASFIPADQHAIFFSSFQSMIQLIDEASANGTPVLQLLEPRSEDADTRSRYQKQLCLGLTELSRVLGPQLIASVAFTGSDPYLRSGSDVAVLFEARSADALKRVLSAQQGLAQLANSPANSESGEIAGIPYQSLISADRSISSYLASFSNVVYVSNSKAQLENLLRTAQNQAGSLAALDEYKFFRQRYNRASPDETAFLVLSDAAIRRWCGPKWRIANARRTRAAAVLSELQAAHLQDMAGAKSPVVLSSRFNLPDTGEFRLGPAGVSSSVYGSLKFMTPISELDLPEVTEAESAAYARWRDSYQRNWRQFFDPIAVRFSVAKEKLGAELTILPLIGSTEYRQLIQVATGAAIAPDAGDPHTNTLLHVALAINTQSKPVTDAGSFVGTLAPGLKTSPFSWLGESISVYAEEDPFWARLQQSTNSETFLEHHFAELPVALRCEVKNPLGLTAFLAAVHAFVDQSAPGMATWKNVDYNGQPYVKVVSKSPISDTAEEFAICYVATPRALIVTLNEPLLKRAMDREAARTAAAQNGPKAGSETWLGKSFAGTAQRRFFELLQIVTRDSYQANLQLLAWNNLPILNEWKRMFPTQDPVKMHEQLWGVRLICPGGGTYVWNEKWHTMESTVFGHPGEPKTSSGHALAEILSAQLGVTFENQGLSAKTVLRRKTAP